MLTRRSTLLTIAGLGPWVMTSTVKAEENDIGKKLKAAVPPHGERTLGDPNAPVTLIEYASATCSHCAEFHNDVWPEVKKSYVDTGKVHFIFRELITNNLALGAFMLARCAPEDKYFAVIEDMFRQQHVWAKTNPKDELFKLVAAYGVDTAAAEACVLKKDLAKAILDTGKRAYEEFGVKGTPAFFVNGFFFDGHKDAKQLGEFIDKFLKSAN